jgi:hypothetical protein
MLAATNSNHSVSTPTPSTAPASAAHFPPPPSIPQLTQPSVHPTYHGPPPQTMPQSYYPPQVPLHPSSTAPPPQQQQQQPLSYYGIPQLPPQQQQSPPVPPTGAIDNIDPSQKVSSPIGMYCRVKLGTSKAMLLQVLRLSQEQIGQLPPAERDAILALVSTSCETNGDYRPTLISDLNSVVLHDGRCLKWRVYPYITQSNPVPPYLHPST